MANKKSKKRPSVDIDRFLEMIQREQNPDLWKWSPSRIITYLLRHRLVDQDYLDSHQREFIMVLFRKALRGKQAAPGVTALWSGESFELDEEGNPRKVTFYALPDRMDEESRTQSIEHYNEATRKMVRKANSRVDFANDIAIPRGEEALDRWFPEYGSDYEDARD